MKDQLHSEAMAEWFQQDPQFLAEYLNHLLETGDEVGLLVALRQMSKTCGGMSALAEKAHLNATQLYRMLSEKGNPQLRSLSAILKVMGLQLSVKPIIFSGVDSHASE